ncbi:hypothetical protein V6B37_06335 [Bifidobacterium breve]|uniref:hypothetical protein n=1 Tax=Bifidobacterium breve TaxID=1685 RepID=UPI0030CE5BBF
MKKIRIMLDQEDGTTVTLGSIETGGQSDLYRCHPRMMYDESVRKPVLDILGRWALHLLGDAEEA